MFEISFGEIVVIGIVALIVLGPERLPKVARTAGIVIGRLQRYVMGVKADLMKEVDASELNQVKQQVQQHVSEIKTDVSASSSSVSSPTKPPTAS